MQLNTMDCNSRANINSNVERDSDLGDEMSHEDHSDEDIRDCDSLDGDHHVGHSGSRRLNKSRNLGDINFPGGGTRSPFQHPDLQMSHHHQFPPNHPLNALGNFMGIGGLHGIPNLQQHNDVLEKLKMQVRDMKMDQDYAAAAHAAAFGSNMLPSQLGSAFTLPSSAAGPFGHGAQGLSVHSNGGSGSSNGNLANGSSANNSFSFASPTAPGGKEVNPASNSSTSSEASNSSQQNNGWSFEEQYKQVRQLYEINDDPKRKEFLDDLFSFMQKRGTPINRLPIMAKSVLDLYELYNLVIARGGLVDVINKKLWQEIIKGLHLPSSITSAAFTLRTQYMKYLYPYECEKKNLSTPAELQAAIDGNRREGRRSSYGQYEAMHNQMQMPSLARQTLAGSMQQMSPLALVTHAAAANNQQAQAAAAAAAAAHHRLMTPPFGQVPNLVKHEIEQRMMEYLKLIQAKEEQHNATLSAVNSASNGGGVAGLGSNGNGNSLNTSGLGNTNPMALSPLAQVQLQQQTAQQQAAANQQDHRRRSQSPEMSSREAALNALEMSRVAFWQMYNNTTSPPASLHASPQANSGGNHHDQQRNEALNLSDSPPNLASIKRERDREGTPEPEREDFPHQPPPAKRSVANSLMPPGFPNFYLPHNLAAAANFHHHASNGGLNQHDSDNEHDEDHDNEEEEDDLHDEHHAHNTTANSSNLEHENETINGRLRHHLHLANNNGHHHRLHHDDHLGGHHSEGNHLQSERQHQDNKSDDSAIENSPTTSSAGGNGHSSPVSTKKIHLTKQHLQQHQQQQKERQQQQKQQSEQLAKEKKLSSSNNSSTPAKNILRETKSNAGSGLGPLETLNILSGMQFKVAKNGLGPNGEQQLLVNLELNGIKYSGLLLSNVKDADLMALDHHNNDKSSSSSSLLSTSLSPKKPVGVEAAKTQGTGLKLEESLTKSLIEDFNRNRINEHHNELSPVMAKHHTQHDDDELPGALDEEMHDTEMNVLNRLTGKTNEHLNENLCESDHEDHQTNATLNSHDDEDEDVDAMENLARKPTTTITATTLLAKEASAVAAALTPTKSALNDNQITSPASSASSSISSSSSSSSSNSSSSSSTATTSSASTTIQQQLKNVASPVTGGGGGVAANSGLVVPSVASTALQNLKDALITS